MSYEPLDIVQTTELVCFSHTVENESCVFSAPLASFNAFQSSLEYNDCKQQQLFLFCCEEELKDLRSLPNSQTKSISEAVQHKVV